MRIVITDCDHESIGPEQEVVARAGAELVRTQSATEEEVIANAAGADAVLVQYAPITAKVLAALPSLRAVGRYGVGVDTVDVAAATARGVAVCNVPDYGTEEVSDHAIALTLSLARGVVGLDRGVRRGSADLDVVKPLHRIAGRTFGVVGLGAIGRATGRKARGVGYDVIGYDVLTQPGTTLPDGLVTTSFDEVLERAHVVSLHVPLTAATHHLIGAAELARMRPDALLINTCRGAVVDTGALVAALHAGAIGGAGLDVHEVEPLPAGSPLTEFDNVVLTPHAAWYSEESAVELKRRVTENVVDVCAGRRPRNILNPEVLTASARQATVSPSRD